MIDLPVADYLDHLFGTLPADEAVCIAQAQERGYLQLAAAPRLLQRIERRPDEYYVCVSTVDPVPRDRDGNTNTPQAMLRRTESDVRNVCMLVLDDIGTKAKAPDLAPSCRKETSAGNQQWDYIIEPLWVGPDEQGAEGRRYFDACYRALAKAGYTDPGAGGVSRVVRLPGSVNKKPGRDGWRTKVLEWEPERVYALEGIMETLGLEPIWESLKQQTMYEGVIPSDIVDPVVAWLHDRGLAGELRGDWLDIRCPWAHEHTDGSETAGYSPLGHGRMPVMRGFQCFHTSHGIKTIYDFLAWVAEQDGPSVDASGVREFHVEQLKQLTRDYTADEAAELLRCSLPALWPGDLPDCVYTRGGNVSTGQRPTQSNVRHIMQRYGIDAKLNLMTRQVELSFCDEQMALLVQDLRHVRRAVLDGCQRVGITSREVDECIVEIAADSAYHPAAVWVDERPWDGVSRLQALIDSVQCREGYEDVFGVYLRRWLIQGVQAWFGWHEPEQMALVLTLVGPQGCGKSEWMKSLMPPPFFRGDVQLDLRHRRVDSVMLMTSAALTELGELDTTFSKSEQGAIKAEISKTHDVYRAPYGRHTETHPRCTLLGATVNKPVFLNDETGSRRFLPSPVERCDAFHGIDMQQVWAEVKTLWEAGEQWWLTDEEERLRAGDADEYRVIGEAEELANQWFEDHDYSSRQTMNVTDFCRKKLQITPSRENVAMVKSVLLARCGKMRRQLDGIKNGWPIPVGYVKSNNLQGGKLALGAKMRNLQGHSDG